MLASSMFTFHYDVFIYMLVFVLVPCYYNSATLCVVLCQSELYLSYLSIIIVTAMVTSYLAKKWQPFNCITPSAVLVLLWNYLMFAQYYLISRFIGESSDEIVSTSWYRYRLVIMTSLGWLLFPFLGLLADVWIGRYKAILIGMFYIMDYNRNWI